MRRGFTLLEMIVAVALIAIFSTTGMVSFQQTTKRHNVENAISRIRLNYTSAKANSLSGKKNCQACGAALSSGYACGTGDMPLLGWEVNLDVTSPTKTYSVSGVCGNTTDPQNTSTRFVMDGTTIPTETLPSNLNYVITSPVSARRVVFRPSGGGIYPVISNTSVITITVTDGTNSRKFTINGAGVISPITP